MNIFEELENATKRKIDYCEMGFGYGLTKKKKDENKKRGSDIRQAVNYKKGSGSSGGDGKTIKHVVKILEQPIPQLTDEQANAASQFFKCYRCGYTCSRLGVIVWHNKNHTKSVCDYDSGIKIPGRKKRRPGVNKNKKKTAKEAADKAKTNRRPTENHSQTNGIAETRPEKIADNDRTRELLMDWDDEEDDTRDGRGDEAEGDEIPDGNGGRVSDAGSEDEAEADSGDDGDYPPPEPKRHRRPMPRAAEVNSAFDALLADTPTSSQTTSNYAMDFARNDSDSEGSDWEKYYCRDGSSSPEMDREELENGANGEVPEFFEPPNQFIEEEEQTVHTIEDEPQEVEAEAIDDGSEEVQLIQVENNTEYSTIPRYSPASVPERTEDVSSDVASEDAWRSCERITSTRSPVVESLRPDDESDDTSDSVCEIEPDAKDDDAPLPAGRSSPPDSPAACESSSASPSTSSKSSGGGPAYMLVAVDAQGNNVPMPALSEGGSHLVAVEASMDDGSTRTLYIDPTHLGENVDLSNLMLHIDNSGLETVIIPSTDADQTPTNATSTVSTSSFSGEATTVEHESMDDDLEEVSSSSAFVARETCEASSIDSDDDACRIVSE